MLSISKSITLNGTSSFDGISVQGYQAILDSETPENIQLSNWINDYASYKIHRTECANDRTEFEDAVFKLQEEMIEEKNKKLMLE